MATTRQRNYQIKRKREGKCETCGRIVFRSGECRRHYVLRAMRRLDPVRAEAFTQRILVAWTVMETMGLAQDYQLEITPAIKKWMQKWEPNMRSKK